MYTRSKTGAIQKYIYEPKVKEFLYKKAKLLENLRYINKNQISDLLLTKDNLDRLQCNKLRIKFILLENNIFFVNGGKPIKDLYNSSDSEAINTKKTDHFSLTVKVLGFSSFPLHAINPDDLIFSINIACAKSKFEHSGELHLEKVQDRYKLLAIQGDFDDSPGKFSPSLSNPEEIKKTLENRRFISEATWHSQNLTLAHKNGKEEHLNLLKPNQPVYLL